MILFNIATRTSRTRDFRFSDGRIVKRAAFASSIMAVFLLATGCRFTRLEQPTLRAGAAAVPITPFGQNADWDGPVTASGVWGEIFTDANHNGRWDDGEPFVEDESNNALDGHSRGKYDGVYLAGFGHNRLATGKHNDLWARALVLDSGATRFAIVSVDLIGYYSHSSYYGGDEIRKLLDPALGIQDVLISSTHNHEGPDTIGLWGANAVSDGKFPRYLRFVDRQIAKAVTQAANSLTAVRIKLGTTRPAVSPTLAGMQTRTGGRPPAFFDEELRVMQFVGADGAQPQKPVVTLINWNTHPESMESENTILTSDFPGAVRESIEKKYGGTAIYVSGDLGAVEIIGDSEDRTQRTEFDGKTFPVSRDKPASFTFERMEAIGRDVAKAAIDAVEHAEWSKTSELELRKAELSVPLENAGYRFLIEKGVLALMKGMEDQAHPRIITTVYALRVGDAQVITTPGELFPEVFYSVDKYRRTDCPAADTHEPAEPAVRNFMTGKYKFVFGLCPDELGYIVPRYDFQTPKFDAEHGLTEAKDACQVRGVPAHYHETNSASSKLAPLWACSAARLLGQNIDSMPACAQHEQAASQEQRQR
jgi:Neutral/alkaline non-lysosomal ceramidase, N-terminal